MDVLIADDSPTSRRLLEIALSKQGHKVASAKDGNEAWKFFQKDNAPRLAVFDWEMPGLTGVELCRKVKERKDAPYTYIILLTGKKKKEDIVTGLESGADDFITKPFDPSELKSRLAAGIRILNYETALAGKNEELARYASQMETLAEDRAKQLVHADRMSSLGVMSAGIAHEINNPLTFILNNIQLLQKFWAIILESLKKVVEKDDKKNKQMKFVLEETPKTLQGALNGVERIRRIVKGLGVFSRKDTGELSKCSINDRIEQALVLCHNALKYHVTVEKQLGENLPEIEANPPQLEQVFINLFVNAAHAMESQEKGILKITTSRKDHFICAVVEDTGPGISEDQLESIWDPFFTTKGEGKGTGLGLSISKEIINNHGGTIRVENNSDRGAKFIIELPVSK